MKKFIYNFFKKYIKKDIEENYDVWGTKIETDLPPEFIITEHGHRALKRRFNCRPDKLHKIMLKAWKTEEHPGYQYTKIARQKHPKGIYKMFNGFVFVFRPRYNKRLGFSQKYLITVYKKNGYQFED